jgi:diaminohydroxyphosphoribosylaminopyrimidine deaminase/5-amino-6-(5-phosphoribosylamino)uracil reductase
VLGGDLPGRALVLTTEVALKRRGRRLVERGAWVEPLADSGPIPGRALLDCLSGHGIGSVLVEGGGELAWTMVESRLVDHVYAFVAPTLLGGGRAPSPVDGDGFERLAGALRLETVGIRRLGDDILVEAVAVGGDG